MSFLAGKTKPLSNVSEGTSGLHQQLIDYITKGGFGGLNPGTSPDAASIEPYQKMFRDQNAMVFGQAKESAGGLTGSGLGNTLGIAGQRASTEQGGFLAQLFEQRRQQDANRQLQLILGTLGSPAGGVTQSYQPGFLDYLMEGAQTAASFIPGGGGQVTPANQRGNNTQSGG